jgi:hypothetical protein
MSIRQQKELNVVEGNACSYFCPTWKPASHAMPTKVSQTTSWIPLCSLPWSQCKRWIDRWDVCTCTKGYLQLRDGVIQVMFIEKIGEYNRKVGKINWTINQALTFGSKHDKIQAWWALNILLKNMLKRVWWCGCSEMEFLNWTICCPMKCSNERRHAQTRDNKRSHAILKCCWKGKVLLSTHVNASRRKGQWSTI